MSHYPSTQELAAFRRSISTPRPWDSIARREASALRSRAYAHGFGSLADVQTFAPSWNPYADGYRRWESTDTWTEDDEPRHPLPIRYQPSFTIG